MKFIITVLIALIHLCTYSQKIDSLTYSKLSKELLQKKHPSFYLNKKHIEQGFIKKGNCIYHRDNLNYGLVCIENSWNKDWVTDFNHDGINDIVIETTESIIPSETFIFHLLTLDKEQKINEIYSLYRGELLGSGGGILGIDSLKKGHIYARIWSNDLFEDSSEEPKPFHLEFFIKNKKLQEKNYSKCKLYTADKKMFIKRKNITESFSFDEYYNEKKTEALLTKQKNYYKASFSGCDNKVLTFNFINKKRRRKAISRTAVKEAWLKHISFLSKKTKFKDLFKELARKLRDKEFGKHAYTEHYGADMTIILKNKQKVYLSFMFRESIEGKRLENDVTIKITPPQKNNLYYWDIITDKLKY